MFSSRECVMKQQLEPHTIICIATYHNFGVKLLRVWIPHLPPYLPPPHLLPSHTKCKQVPYCLPVTLTNMAWCLFHVEEGSYVCVKLVFIATTGSLGSPAFVCPENSLSRCVLRLLTDHVIIWTGRSIKSLKTILKRIVSSASFQVGFPFVHVGVKQEPGWYCSLLRPSSSSFLLFKMNRRWNTKL